MGLPTVQCGYVLSSLHLFLSFKMFAFNQIGVCTHPKSTSDTSHKLSGGHHQC